MNISLSITSDFWYAYLAIGCAYCVLYILIGGLRKHLSFDDYKPVWWAKPTGALLLIVLAILAWPLHAIEMRNEYLGR